MHYIKGTPVPGQLRGPGCGEHRDSAGGKVPREPQQHLPYRIMAVMSIVEDHDDRPISTRLGEQTGDPFDDVVAKGVSAGGRVMGVLRAASERRKIAKAASAGVADSIIVRTARTQPEGLCPTTERRDSPEQTTACGQPDGEVVAVW